MNDTTDGDDRPPGEEARHILAAAFEIEVGAIPADAGIGRFERWDSLAHMRLILGLEAFLDRSLESHEIVSIGDLGDVERLIATGAGAYKLPLRGG